MTQLTSVSSLITTLKERFHNNLHRHANLVWKDVENKLMRYPEKIEKILIMEATGGEPDVVVMEDGLMYMIDCAKESPSGRRSWCYDDAALVARKAHPPKASAMGWANQHQLTLLNEEEYKQLQQLEAVDLKTSSWLATPDAIRKLGGAIFGDRRYNQVFIYHNGAESYYAARGCRVKLLI